MKKSIASILSFLLVGAPAKGFSQIVETFAPEPAIPGMPSRGAVSEPFLGLPAGIGLQGTAGARSQILPGAEVQAPHLEAAPRIPRPVLVPAAEHAEGESAATLNLEEERVLNQVQKELGPIVSEEDAPVLYNTLRRSFDRLSQAQQELVPSDVVSMNHLHIVDSSVVNAFAYRIQSPGVRKIDNLVVITTAFIRKQFGAASRAPEIRLGLIRTIGTLAHELAHPLDNVDKDSLQKGYQRHLVDQAVEARADAEGMMIAKKAGFPVEAVYEDEKNFLADDLLLRNPAEALASTHPTSELRAATQRMLLTLDRYEHGKLVPRFPEPTPPAIVRELHAINKSQVRWTFDKPRSLVDAIERIQKVSDLRENDLYKKVEFNRLLLSVDQFLLQRKEELAPAELDKFIELNKMLAKSEGLSVFDRPEMSSHFTQETHSTDFLKIPSHFALIQKIPAYRSPAYLAWIKTQYFTQSDKRFGVAESALKALGKMLPAGLIFELFEDGIVEYAVHSMRTLRNPRYVYSSLEEKGPLELKVRLADLFHRKILSQLSPEERVDFFTNAVRESYSYVFPQTRKNEDKKIVPVGIRVSKMDLMADPRKKELRDIYRAVVRSIWEQRGYYGALDIVLQFGNMDWDSIFEVLGLDRQEGRSSLRHAVKAFTKSEKYADLLRTIAGGSTDRTNTIKQFGYVGKFEPLAWIDGTLAPYLSGRFNEAIQKEPELQALAKNAFTGTFWRQERNIYRKNYLDRFEKGLARGTISGFSLKDLIELHQEILVELSGKPNDHGIAHLEDLQAMAIDRSSLPLPVKQEFLKAIFLKNYSVGESASGLLNDMYLGYWARFDIDNFSVNKIVMGVLVKNKVLKNTVDFFRFLLADKEYMDHAKSDDFRQYFTVLSYFKNEIFADIDEVFSGPMSDSGKFDFLLGIAVNILDPGNGRYVNREVSNSRGIRDIKNRVIELAGNLNVSREDRLKLFSRLTATGPTRGTDEFFKKHLAGGFDAEFDAGSYKTLRSILENQRLSGSNLQLDMAERLLGPEVLRLESKAPDAEIINSLIGRLNFYAPDGSSAKDQYLEELAWRLGVEGRNLNLIEDEKSYNWKKANPLLVNLGSVLSSQMTRWNAVVRLQFMEYLLNPESKDLPASIVKEIEKSLYEAALSAKDRSEDPGQLKRETREAAYFIKLKLESRLADATPFERIPLFELLIAGGEQALSAQHGFPYNITRSYLKYEPDSTEEKMLFAFLDVVPERERSVTLAYLLSQAGEQKATIKNILEVFQTVGIKFGQLASTWKILGETVARETATLKDDARSLSKAEILRILDETLTAEERGRIKRLKRIVGSASLMTVVMAELQDGREAAVLVQRPYAKEQIESNLELATQFLKALERRGVQFPHRMFGAVLGAVKSQLGQEQKMTAEARRIREAKILFERQNRSMKSNLGGWRFAVPDLVSGFQVRDNLLFLEFAGGVTFDKLPKSARKEVGPAIVESSLAALFRYGWFDADRHAGNQIIDLERKIIYMIDFGQTDDFSKTRPWSADDRYRLAQFLRALDAGDAGGIIRYAGEMGQADAVKLDAGGLRHLRRAIDKALADARDPLERLIAVHSALTENGLILDRRFSFGAMKGLMTLYGQFYIGSEGAFERYVSETQFRNLLSREIEGLLKRKLPVYLRDRWFSRRDAAVRTPSAEISR